MKYLSVVATVCVLASPAQAHKHHYRGHHGLPWCGQYMAQYFGKTARRLWLAREWATEGQRAPGPGVGVVVVWPHHVGVIKAQAPDGGWVVHSGNDGGRVRTRERSVANAIAFRYVSN